MSPKPFPYPLAIGIDVCKVGRMYQLMRKGPRMTSFARRVFTRSEFMALRLRFLKMHADDPETKIPEEDPANYENCQWTLPSLKFDEDTRNADPNIFRLAEYLAGRWAVKEAVIKAHRYRKLTMQDITISSQPAVESLRRSPKFVATVAPIPTEVLMSRDVAIQRGLRGFDAKSTRLPRFTGTWHTAEGEPTTSRIGKYVKRRLNEPDAGQLAEISISHDGGVAIASCLAVDVPQPGTAREIILDDGTGPALHELEWGDASFDTFTSDFRTKRRSDFSESSEEPNFPGLPSPEHARSHSKSWRHLRLADNLGHREQRDLGSQGAAKGHVYERFISPIASRILGMFSRDTRPLHRQSEKKGDRL